MSLLSHNYDAAAHPHIATYTIPYAEDPAPDATGAGWLIPGGGKHGVPNCVHCSDRIASMRSNDEWGEFESLVFRFSPDEHDAPYPDLFALLQSLLGDTHGCFERVERLG